MKVYSGPGRGRKQCPECKEYVGVRNTDCKCGHMFTSTLKKGKKKPTIKTKGGPGLKHCENCDQYISIGCKKCPSCSHKFVIIPKEERVKPPSPLTPDEEEAVAFLSAMGGGTRLRQNVILTPSEKCPITLRGTTEDDVWEFCEFLVADGKVMGRFYAPSAIRYFVREKYSVNSKEYKEVVYHIDRWIHSKEK